MAAGTFRTSLSITVLLTAALLAGCTATGEVEQTAAIAGQTGAAPGGTAPAVAANGTASGQVVANAQGAPVATTAAQAVPVAMAECEQLKTEMVAFKADKIPEKLAQFGQSKYSPTPEESSRFARYVAVSQANKAKCATFASTPAIKKKPAKAAMVDKAVVKKAVVMKKKAMAPEVVPAEAAADPLMDPMKEAPVDGVMTTGSSG